MDSFCLSGTTNPPNKKTSTNTKDNRKDKNKHLDCRALLSLQEDSEQKFDFIKFFDPQCAQITALKMDFHAVLCQIVQRLNLMRRSFFSL